MQQLQKNNYQIYRIHNINLLTFINQTIIIYLILGFLHINKFFELSLLMF